MTEQKTTINENELMQLIQREEQTLHAKQQQIERRAQLLGEVLTAKETLKELEKNKGKLLVSIGATILIEVQALENTKVKRGFSDTAYKDESTKETMEWLQKKEEQVKKQLEKLNSEYSQSEYKYNQLIGILKQIDAEKQRALTNAKPQFKITQ